MHSISHTSIYVHAIHNYSKMEFIWKDILPCWFELSSIKEYEKGRTSMTLKVSLTMSFSLEVFHGNWKAYFHCIYNFGICQWFKMKVHNIIMIFLLFEEWIFHLQVNLMQQHYYMVDNFAPNCKWQNIDFQSGILDWDRLNLSAVFLTISRSFLAYQYRKLVVFGI